MSYFARWRGCGARSALAVGVAAAALCLHAACARAETAGHVTGIGGIIFTSKNPKALTAWYHDVLGLHIEAWGGAMLRTDAPGQPPLTVWSPMPLSTDELAPSRRDFMVNFAVDDLDALVAKLHRKGVKIVKQDDSDPFGKFADVLDPDGTKIELWQPRKK